MGRTKTPDAAIEAGWVLMRLAAEREDVEARIVEQIRAVLAAGGSWTTVGVALGVTKQAAQQRYSRRL